MTLINLVPMKARKSDSRLIKNENEEEATLDSIRGYIDYIVFSSEQGDGLSSFYILKCKNPYTGKRFTATGIGMNLFEDDYVEFCGNWTMNEKYGKQFSFKYTKRPTDDKYGAENMMQYLFGPKTAFNISKAFDGDYMDAYDTFKNNENLFRGEIINVVGVGPKKINKAYEKYQKHMAVDTLYMRFSKFGLSIDKALKLSKKWGTNALAIIDKNPYKLCAIELLSFEIVDRIAKKFYHIGEYDNRRILCGIMSIMHEAKRSTGDCYIELDELNKLTSKRLDVDEAKTREKIAELIREKKLALQTEMIDGSKIDGVFLPFIRKAEDEIAKSLVKMTHLNSIVKEVNANKIIEQYQKTKGFRLADKQIEAAKTSAINQVSIISGPPGSGKTTIVDLICNIFKQSKKNVKIRLAAPTGKAAKRMTESTGLPASTIHRLLGYQPDGTFKYNEKHHLPSTDVLIVDEFSMTDILMFYRLIMSLSESTILILVGDKAQLPSVDCGQVLEDLLKVPEMPKTILNKIYRQKEGSTLLQRCLDIADGKVPDLAPASDFEMIEQHDVEKVFQSVCEIYNQEVKKRGLNNVCLLVPQNVGPLGVTVFNEYLQEMLNPYDCEDNEVKIGKRFLRKNDIVIQLENRPEKNIYNGMVGEIVEVMLGPTHLEDIITVAFGDELVDYTRDEFNELKLAYGITVHKSQGSGATRSHMKSMCI